MRDTTAADNALAEVFGLGVSAIEGAMAVKGFFPKALFDRFVRVIDDSGAIELLTTWRAEDAPSAAGRKAHLSYRAVLVVFFLNTFWGLSYSYQDIAYTITHRLTPEQTKSLGFDQNQGDVDDWYHRAWRTVHRLLDHIDPWHDGYGLGRRLTGEEFATAQEKYDPAREARAHQFAACLVRASVEMLPKKYLANYRGDLALDSTFMPVLGLPNPNNAGKSVLRDMLNGDFQVGWYVRDGNHDGSNKPFASPGYEGDTGIMADAKGGAFPFPLITGLALHLPGKLKQGPRAVIDQHADFTDKRGLVIVDRAFNNLSPQYFQEPVRRHRFETVYDYRKNQLGPQGSVPGHPIIIVDGVPYVNRMPETYVMISRWHAEGKIDPATGEPYSEATRAEIHQARTVYQLKPKGRIDEDGHQRFEYPNPRNYIAFDPTTGKVTKDQPKGSVTLRLDPETIKHLQKYPWMSADWIRSYGQRNQVEMSNRLIKDQRAENLGDPKARTGRGFAYNYLAAIFATISTNIRRIIVGITKLHTTDSSGKPKQRARKRRDSRGVRLTREPRAMTPARTKHAKPPHRHTE